LPLGVGNGSTFRMIPTIFRTLREREAVAIATILRRWRRRGASARPEAAVTIGFSSAVAAFGGFFIPITLGASIKLTGSPQGALLCFSLFYLSCVAITWRWYSRKGAEAPC
jgi:NNP family nitrate/nitrite transporter-like MFS transporter